MKDIFLLTLAVVLIAGASLLAFKQESWSSQWECIVTSPAEPAGTNCHPEE